MPNLAKKIAYICACAGVFGIASTALAATPNLYLSASGSDNVTLNISNADPNSSVQLSYTQPGSSLATTISNFGYTNSSGYFSTSVSASSYGINSGAQLYVTVNGQQSNQVTYSGSGYCYSGNCGIGGLTFSQTNVSLNVGQSTTITMSSGVNMNAYPPYVSTNSNSSVASASISGSQLTVYGNNSGSTTITVCLSGGSTCGSVYVSVGGSYYGGGLSLNQTNVYLSVGQTANVTATNNYYGSLYVSSNSNSSIASASASGGMVNIFANGSGSTTLNICASGNNACASVYVYVSGTCYSGNCGSGLSLSQTNVTLNVGQTTTVTAYNFSGNLYVSNSGNAGVVTATVSGNQVSLYGAGQGTATVTVCGSGTTNCGSIFVSVGSGSGGAVTFSVNNLNLNLNQSQTITVYGNYGYTYGSFYISANTNPSAVNATISGNTLTLYGQNTGSATITVCQSSGGCGSLYVTVGGSSGTGLSLSQTYLNISVGQTQSVTASNAAGLYVSNNSNTSVVSVNASGNQASFYGLGNGSSTVTLCASSANQCATVYVTVGTGNSTLSFSQNNVNLYLGQSMSISIYSTTGSSSYYISNNSNSGFVTAGISGSTLTVYGQNNGSSTITVCQYSTNACGNIFVNVGGSSGYGNIWFSQSSPTLTLGQNMYVTIYPGNTTYYISNNSNSNVVTASISGNTLNLYAQNSGTATLSICQTGYSGNCASLYVSTTGNSGGSLYFTTTSLPQPTVNQYYNQQLQASGGSTPYTFMIISGSLPNGLSLSSSGQILGTPTSNASQTFTVRVTDNYSRTTTQSFTLTPGGVMGASTYASGTLINENGTVYMVYKNTKEGFASAAVFLGLGFNFGQVISVNYSGLTDSGYIIRNASAQHPWGTWIKSGQTVYFVHETGLIPVGDYGTFLNNGGQDNLVVPANTWDFRLPMLSLMTYNDPRLH